MPKIIKGIEEKLLLAAKDILWQEGYDKLSMRRVATECGIAVGTIYNYYPNKEVMLAGIMIEDWQLCLKNADLRMVQAEAFEDGLVAIYESLEKFIAKYRTIWMQSATKGSVLPEQSKYHPLLRSQIEQLIYKLKEKEASAILIPDMLIPLLAETLLAAALHPDIAKESVYELGRRVKRG